MNIFDLRSSQSIAPIVSALVLFACFFIEPTHADAQRARQRAVDRPERNKGNGLLVNLNYGGGRPLADLAIRFGGHQNIGLGLDYITTSNVLIGLESSLLFGTNVKEDPLAILRTPEGDIIGNDQAIADVSLKERGVYLGSRVGYLFGIKHKRSGLLVTVGAGYFQHRIRIQDNTQTMVQLAGDYKTGYDRLTGGLAVSQFIGYQRLVQYSGLSWCVGLESVQAFTQPLRNYDFSTMTANSGKRTDIILGVKLGVIVPFVFEDAPDEIYY
jgi:hypothetical protein